MTLSQWWSQSTLNIHYGGSKRWSQLSQTHDSDTQMICFFFFFFQDWNVVTSCESCGRKAAMCCLNRRQKFARGRLTLEGRMVSLREKHFRKHKKCYTAKGFQKTNKQNNAKQKTGIWRQQMCADDKLGYFKVVDFYWKCALIRLRLLSAYLWSYS